MSHQVFCAVIRGARAWVEKAEEEFKKARGEMGDDATIGFGEETAFCLPMAYVLMGLEARKVKDLEPILEHCRELLGPVPSEKLWLPYLGDGLDAGAATMLAQEVTTALMYGRGWKPEEGWQGFISDTIMRELGIQLVDGRMPGFAAILGPAPTAEIAQKVVQDLQMRSILSFLVANSDGKTMREQLYETEVIKPEMSMKDCWDVFVVPVGPTTLDAIHVLDWSIRSALTFGGRGLGESRECIDYTKKRIHAFGITFGPIPDDWYAVGAAAILLGYPIISDSETTPEVRPTGVTVREAIVVEKDPDKMVPTCIDTRAVKVKIEKVDIPVAFAAAFEGERVRKDDMQVQFGSKFSTAFEYLHMVDPASIDDGAIELTGPDIDSVEVGGAMDLGVEVFVGGRAMQRDFESILERQVHIYVNHATGLMHTGQRDLVWSRISKKAFNAGFRLKHIGTILHAKIHDEYGAIVDKVAVKIYTDLKAIEGRLTEAREAYRWRDDRLGGMTDESVDIFYSCTLCQSYAPEHVCIVTPERLGLCGAYNWLDCRANVEINPTGPNRPVKKGRTIDVEKGEWEGVNQFVYEHSGHKIRRFAAYSMVDAPMTSCGCFECIMCLLPIPNEKNPEATGVMVTNREYTGPTPMGMNFGELAKMAGGGAQTPGMMGIGRLYLTSRKFISAEAAQKRLVWMPKELKESIKERFLVREKELEEEGLWEKIADETVTTEMDGVAVHSTEVSHPAATMEPIVY